MSTATVEAIPKTVEAIDLDAQAVCGFRRCSNPATWRVTIRHVDTGTACRAAVVCDRCRTRMEGREALALAYSGAARCNTHTRPATCIWRSL